VGFHPTPHKLFEKSLTKTLAKNRKAVFQDRGQGDKIPLWVFEGETLKV